MLSFGIGSAGTPPERYTLQIPFALSESESIQLSDMKATFYLEGHEAELRLLDGLYFLKVFDFHTRHEALSFLDRLRYSLLRLTVLRRLGLRPDDELQEVKILESPQDIRGNPNFLDLFTKIGWTHLDGYYDQRPIVIIPEHLRLMVFGIGQGRALSSMTIDSFAADLQQGLELPPNETSADERIVLAIELFASSRYELQPRSRLITLVTTLEALVEDQRESEFFVEVIEHLLKHTRREFSSIVDPKKLRELARLRSRLGNLKRKSILENLREVVSRNPKLDGSPHYRREKMTEVYTVRSNLLHDGSADRLATATSLSWLNKVVPSILLSRLETPATLPDNPSQQ